MTQLSFCIHGMMTLHNQSTEIRLLHDFLSASQKVRILPLTSRTLSCILMESIILSAHIK
jgi:hypothetical protein